jgi:hypothetical protein
MTLKRFHLIKDRFLFDDYESGLYFDLWPVHRPAGDENIFNAVIDQADEELHSAETSPAKQNWYCTLFLTDTQVYNLSQRYRDQFAPKSYLLLFKAGFDGKALPTNEWFSAGSGGLICNPTGAQKGWLYYTNWNANMLGFRFRVAHKEEVDAYIPPSGNDTIDDTTIPGGSVTIPTSIDIHFHDHSKPEVW